MEFGRSAFTKFNNPDFVKLAEVFGAYGYRAKNAKEFSSLLKKAKDSTSVPVIIAVDVDYSANSILLEANNDAP